jgi:hypothetical protein
VKAKRQGYTSPASASRFARTKFWREIREEYEQLEGFHGTFALERGGSLRRNAYQWWREDPQAKLERYLEPNKKRYAVGSAASKTLQILELRTPSMRFAVGDTQQHIKSYIRQIEAAGYTFKKRSRL